MPKKSINCPLCGHNIKHTNLRQMGTHMWSCPVCPFVGFEFYEVDDIIRLKKYLTE